MSGRFAGKHALVTGATQGLGAELARALQREGAAVILSGIDDERGKLLLRDLPGCEYWHLDVAEEANWINAAARLRDRGTALDLLVNNAAIVRYEAITGCSTASFQEVLNVNLLGTFLGIRELCSVMPRGQHCQHLILRRPRGCKRRMQLRCFQVGRHGNYQGGGTGAGSPGHTGQFRASARDGDGNDSGQDG